MICGLFAGILVNLDKIVSIERHNDMSKVQKKYIEEKQEVETIVTGDPYTISINLVSGPPIVMGYKDEMKRDNKFTMLSKTFGAEE